MADKNTVLITGHSANDRMRGLLLNCINSFKQNNFEVVVSDHFYHKDIFEAADVYVINESNPVLTPKDYERYNLYHVCPKHEHSLGYTTFTPYGTFASYAIIELVKKGFEQVKTDKALVINYDFIYKKPIDELFKRPEEGVFFRYPYPNSVYSSVYILNKRLVSKLDTINSIDDYAKNLKYMEPWMYDFYKDENVKIFDNDYREYFDGDYYYRAANLDNDTNFWLLPDGKVLMKVEDEAFEFDKRSQYEYHKNGKRVIFNLDELHFKWHTARRM